MTIYAVLRRPGPAFDPRRPIDEQEAWPAHAAFMTGLAAEGLVLMAGPLMGEGALLIVRAGTEEEVAARLADDPWAALDLLGVDRILRWDVRIGAPA
ncbi:MAG TPA: YciI family protein [Allosphingosinicella sp.]|nr:YciI family protein [Allosphingosinicella sp.]